jgi:RluA family pseudouridine synthase
MTPRSPFRTEHTRTTERFLTLRTSEAHAGRRLDDVLAGWLPEALGQPVSKAKLRRLVLAGSVRLEGRPARRPAQPLAPGQRLEARVRLDRLTADRTAGDVAFRMTARRILYEDDGLIAVDKPPGLPTAPTVDASRPSLYGAVKEFLAERAGSGEAYLGLHQRLDRDTSGVVLFTKHVSMNPGLAACFEGHKVAKTYHALTGRPPRESPGTWRAVSDLAAAGKGSRSRVVRVTAGGTRAETDLRILRTGPGGALVDARPHTGRKHQIRVHLAEAGMPILGDDSYGAAGAPSGPHAVRLMLHALRLELAHPATGVRLVIESPYPDDFRRALAAVLDAPRHSPRRTRRR